MEGRICLAFVFLIVIPLNAQEIKMEEKLFATFGNMSEASCGDDDFSQVVFFALPHDLEAPFYLRAFDPDCGGVYDHSEGLWETNTIFEVYGGSGCISNRDARQTQPEGNYKSGKVLQRELFARESEQDGKWFSFGPFTSSQGELLEEFPGYSFFKLIVEGRTGNDGNIYGLLLSLQEKENTPVKYSVLFDYERTYPEENSILVSRPFSNKVLQERVELPVELITIPKETEYTFSIEPDDQ